MICHKCKTPVSAGDKCPACGTTLALLVPPPGDFSKKDELYKKTLELRAGHLQGSQFADFLQVELTKISTARGKLHEGDAPVLLEGLDLWQQALAKAESWLASSSDFDLQAALNLATQADECINRSIMEHFETNKELVRTLQAEARLRENPPPELPEDGLLVGFELRNNPK
ncbi:MAG: hypothetical protein KF760_12895 [Candidatus Eremiobacteraeota bacterium]|nr:hypothetical protein [Candidatus Eremiobacteraeota bacterium]MCW5871783.1 hypothetical protein [Candidatus Eremiobacteraeota bacterium]